MWHSHARCPCGFLTDNVGLSVHQCHPDWNTSSTRPSQALTFYIYMLAGWSLMPRFRPVPLWGFWREKRLVLLWRVTVLRTQLAGYMLDVPLIPEPHTLFQQCDSCLKCRNVFSRVVRIMPRQRAHCRLVTTFSFADWSEGSEFRSRQCHPPWLICACMAVFLCVLMKI